MPDPELLDRASSMGRILFTRDDDLLVEAVLASNQQSSIVNPPDRLTIDELRLLIFDLRNHPPRRESGSGEPPAPTQVGPGRRAPPTSQSSAGGYSSSSHSPPIRTAIRRESGSGEPPAPTQVGLGRRAPPTSQSSAGG